MIGRTIRARMVWASVLPVLLVVATVANIFWWDRVSDLERAHQQRLDLLAHQVGLYSAYGLFAGDTRILENVVADVQKSEGVRTVRVFDRSGTPVARNPGTPILTLAALQSAEYQAQQRAKNIDVRIEMIQSNQVPLEDLYAQEAAALPAAAPLGTAVLEVSRDGLQAAKRQALWTALWVGLAGVVLGTLLAYRLGNWVVRPMERIAQRVRRLGQGDFAEETPVSPDDPLHALQTSLNQTVRRLSWSREELEQQVADVTQELRAQKEQAERATLAKSRFLAAASHDLRQPSHALGMLVARLGQLPLEPQARQLAEHLELSVQTMQDLLDGLLDLSRLDSGQVQARIGPVNLNELLVLVRSALTGMAEAKGLRLRIRPTHHWVLSDATLLHRMVVNLVTNAIRYTEQGTVLVCCRPCDQGQGVRLEVRDSGIGIAQQHHADVFKEFFQLASRAGDRNFGMGLGLNIVQRTAALLEHPVRLRSQPGQGTLVSIAMPASPADALGALAAASAEQVQVDLLGLRVLLIEDNAQAREAVCGLLRSWGCTVGAASGLPEALALLHDQDPPQVVLSDYHLGAAETGLDCIQALRRAAGQRLPACLMSGETDADFLQAAKTLGLPLLHKPVRPAKLRALLRRLAA